MTKALYPIDTAKRIAEIFTEAISPTCEKIVIGGSIRREKSLVGDIELLVIPHYTETEVRKDLFTYETRQVCQLEAKLTRMDAAGVIEPRLKSNGSLISWLKPDAQKRYVAAWFNYGDGAMPVDIFIIRPDRLFWWGWHLLLRTGPGDANQALVTPIHKYGFKPSNIYIDDGKIWKDSFLYPLPDEESVFDLWGMTYVPPRIRSIEAYQKARRAYEAANE